MATYLTWAEIWAELQASELDLSEEDDFFDETAAKAAFNEGVDAAEEIIMQIHADYFLTRQMLSCDADVEEVDLPDNIYAMKIRAIICTENDVAPYEVKRLRDWRKFLEYRVHASSSGGGSHKYQYMLINEDPGSPRIILSPPPISTGAFLECWYTRNANRMVDSDDICDIPEFRRYCYAHVKTKVYEKEGGAKLAKAEKDKADAEAAMRATLSDMVPDNANEIEPDFSHYREHV